MIAVTFRQDRPADPLSDEHMVFLEIDFLFHYKKNTKMVNRGVGNTEGAYSMATTTLFQNPTSQTLLIPLIIRATEGSHPRSLFRDKAAEDVVSRLPAEAFHFSLHPFMRAGTAVRVRYFDDLTKEMLEKTERPVIVQLGCGLDTRFSRTDSGKGVQINIDLPEVIALRREILPRESGRDLNWPGDLLERDWMDRLEREYAGHRFLFILEGVLMYFTEKDARALLSDIADRFPGSHIAFDTAGSRAARVINKKSAVKELKAALTWTYDDDGSLDAWHPGLRRLERACYFNRFKTRWGILWLMHYTPMGKSSAMFHFLVEKNSP